MLNRCGIVIEYSIYNLQFQKCIYISSECVKSTIYRSSNWIGIWTAHMMLVDKSSVTRSKNNHLFSRSPVSNWYSTNSLIRYLLECFVNILLLPNTFLNLRWMFRLRQFTKITLVATKRPFIKSERTNGYRSFNLLNLICAMVVIESDLKS